ncbi:PhzF family phenazine biosynthesis protein [Promicromonospora iranensis]|uniref:PhzF family phenazine biosynthesis protein n=1 Tax=Promicromonospora iranensis TaxID=1105144 RepID=A0ABU2CWB6_9MICO|nr:PhzF family phenazine biosynthesis protein [Promicromonospora iranensis]MDR7385641.1 PhzF family phenazine biosynthesis protein [Promicromonospora iranensis]
MPSPTPRAYHHVDVFASRPYTGNSLAVLPDALDLTDAQLLTITQELRHFETIFLGPVSADGTVAARVFDLFEELPFAGHPLLGAAAVLHASAGDPQPRQWVFELRDRQVRATTRRSGVGYHATIDQGRPEFLGTVAGDAVAPLYEALDLPGPTAGAAGSGSSGLPLEVVSTGLRYLIVPVRGGLDRARIVRPDFAALLAEQGAQYAYLIDPDTLEGRHWNNDGIMEDVATGSAAGCVGAYLARHGVVPTGVELVLHQGRFTGRPSELHVLPEGTPADLHNVRVGGEVALVARGFLDALPG